MGEITYAPVVALLASWHEVEGRALLGTPEYALSDELPENYKTALPFIRVTRIGGPREYGIDRALVRAEVFDAEKDTASTLANKLDAAVEARLLGYSDGVGRVILTEVRQGAVFAQWDDPQVARYMSLYLIQVGA